MSLPDLMWQMAYGRLAWAIVIAALLCSWWPAAWRLARPKAVALLLAGAALQALPGAASPAYWLGLAFQWPSAAMTGFCVLRLVQAWRGARDAVPASLQRARQGSWQHDAQQRTTLTPAIAAAIALAGAVLYLDGMGVLAIGLYYWGFGPTAAPALALLLALACAAAAIAGRARAQALALLFALTLFSVLRLPTGNLWDALLDPVLWGWAMVSLGLHAWRRRPHAGAVHPIEE